MSASLFTTARPRAQRSGTIRSAISATASAASTKRDTSGSASVAASQMPLRWKETKSQGRSGLAARKRRKPSIVPGTSGAGSQASAGPPIRGRSPVPRAASPVAR